MTKNRQAGIGAPQSLLFSIGLFVFGLIVLVIAAVTAWMIVTLSGDLLAKLLTSIITLAFGAAGIGLIVLALRIPRSAREQRQRIARHPDQPWLWREDWEQGFARGLGRSQAKFRMSSMPGVLGGRLQGSVETGAAVPLDPLVCTLSCISWKFLVRTSVSEILWQDQATVLCSAGSDGAQAKVEFNIPFDLRSTGEDRAGNREHIFWRLTTRSVDGSFQASFTVPVFATAQSDPSRTREALAVNAATQLGGYAPAPSRIEKTLTPHGVQYRFPRARNRPMAAVVTGFALIMSGIAAVLGFALAVHGTLAMLVGLLVTGAFAALLLLMAAWLWFAETTVIAAVRELVIHSSCLGFMHTRVVHGEEILGFDIRPGMQEGSQVFYDVWLQLAAGKVANAGTGMEKTEAVWFVGELREDLGMP